MSAPEAFTNGNGLSWPGSKARRMQELVLERLQARRWV